VDIFKLFKQQEKGKTMLKAPPPMDDQKGHKSTLVWNHFWGAYDYLMEIAALRQSVNFPTDRGHFIRVEEMFIEALEDLKKSSQSLLDDRAEFKKSQEEK
jgi:hypothetical protein